MIEVCFNDSVKGSLKLARHVGSERSKQKGVIGFCFEPEQKCLFEFFAKRKALKEFRKREEEMQKKAVSLGEESEGVLGISFGFSEGDIKEPITLGDCLRKKRVVNFSYFEGYSEEDSREYNEELWNNYIEDLEKLKLQPDKIRIWVDNTPDACCGLLFIADVLEDSNTEIHVVELGNGKLEDDLGIEYWRWGEVEHEVLGRFLGRERILTREEIKALSNEWKALQGENASLRVVENGVVISADESYYDEIIKKEFRIASQKVARITGAILAKGQVPMGDAFIAKRIKMFIEKGELEIVEDSVDRFYEVIVRRSAK